MSNLGRLVRQAREQAHLSHRALARKTRCSTASAVRAEQGRGTLRMFRALLRGTGWRLVMLAEGVPVTHNIGRALAACRRRARLSCADVAAKAGLCAQAVRDCETDAATSTAATVTAIARALGVRIELAR